MKNCKICGKGFEPKSNFVKCCSPECTKENQRQSSKRLNKIKQQNQSKENRAKAIAKQTGRNPINTMADLALIATEASKNQTSYGKYVAGLKE